MTLRARVSWIIGGLGVEERRSRMDEEEVAAGVFRPLAEMLNRHEWYVTLYGLAANRANGIAQDRDKAKTDKARDESIAQTRRARDEALLLSLASVGRLDEAMSADASSRWLAVLESLDSRLFTAPPGLQEPQARKRRSNHVRRLLTLRRASVRAAKHHLGRGSEEAAAAAFLRFLDDTIEPSALILLAGLQLGLDRLTSRTSDLTALGVPAPGQHRAETLDIKRIPHDHANLRAELQGAIGNDGLSPGLLIASVMSRPLVSGRARYNLACFFAQAAFGKRGPVRRWLIDHSREQLLLALNSIGGASRTAMCEWALKDQTLRPMVDDWPEGRELLKNAAPPKWKP